MVLSLRYTTYLVFLKRETVELSWEHTHSYGDVQRAGHFKREKRIGAL